MPETERLRSSAEIAFINATSLSIDMYVNGEPEPSLCDPASFAVGPTLVVTGDRTTPFQVYAFVARMKGEPDGEVLAAGSADMERGRSYTGVFHWRPDASFQLSIYENDLSRGTEARLTVRNASSLNRLSWTLTPNGETPEPPADVRSGTLGHAQWQIARGVTPNDYRFGAYADGGVVAEEEDLDIGLEQNLIVHIVGAPYPTGDSSLRRRWLVIQVLEYDPGIKADDSLSDPAPPIWTADRKRRVVIDYSPVTLKETVGGRVQVGARDPDGWILSFRVLRVDPDTDGFVIGDGAVSPSAALGASAAATLWVDPQVPDGDYEVTLEVNAATLAERATGVLAVRVQGVTIDRLTQLVALHRRQPSIEPSYADQLSDRLDAAAAALASGNTAKACKLLKAVLTRVDTADGRRMTAAAIADITREAEALRKDLGCA